MLYISYINAGMAHQTNHEIIPVSRFSPLLKLAPLPSPPPSLSIPPAAPGRYAAVRRAHIGVRGPPVTGKSSNQEASEVGTMEDQ